MQTCQYCQRTTKYGCTRKACELKDVQARAAKLAAHFAPGNVIFGDYWRSYDKVVTFHPTTLQRGWSVDVIHCDSTGNTIPGERIRNHCTYPDKRDIIVSIA